MTPQSIRDHYLPPDLHAFRQSEPPTGRLIVIAPTRAACETIELALQLDIETVLTREHGEEIRGLARSGAGFGIVASTGTGKTLSVRPIAEEILKAPLRVGVVNREREATPETPTWNVVIVTTGIARRWFQEQLISRHDTIVVDEIHQTSAELELCLALGKRAGCRFIWLSATVDPAFYAEYLSSAQVLETSAFDPALAARVTTRMTSPLEFLNERFVRHVMRERRGVAVFVPTRAEVEQVAAEVGERWSGLTTAFYHGGEPIRVIRPFLEGAPPPFLLAMTAAGQSALNIRGLDTVVIYDARYTNIVIRGRNVLTRQYLGPNEILQMAGRVHGRVAGGEVIILTDRSLDFASLKPGPPEFQLAGDTERVALTAAALGIDLGDLDLPVPLDRPAYRAALRRLGERGIVLEGRLTPYGRDVEALPVDRPWGELLVHADDAVFPYVAVAANIDSLHRMTRDEHDLHGLIVHGSDHLTAYNVFCEAVNQHSQIGQVYGLPRHIFDEGLEELCERRGVLVKALEDIALGTASVYRALERPLPQTLPHADRNAVNLFRDLIARIMPFQLSMDEELADGERVRLSRSSFCGPGVVAGSVRYFADRFGTPRGSIEGTNLPYELLRRYAKRSGADVVYRDGKRRDGLFVERATEYFGFALDRVREPLGEPFPEELAGTARATLARALQDGLTPHPDRNRVAQASQRLDEYWRRSGGTLHAAAPAKVTEAVLSQLAGVTSWQGFLEHRVTLDLDALVSAETRADLDALPSSVTVHGDRASLAYEMEGTTGVVTLRVREGQARRLKLRDLPAFDRPVRFSVTRKGGAEIRAASLDEVLRRLADWEREHRRKRTVHRRRR